MNTSAQPVPPIKGHLVPTAIHSFNSSKKVKPSNEGLTQSVTDVVPVQRDAARTHRGSGGEEAQRSKGSG